MRPSRHMLALVIGLAALSVGLVVLRPEDTTLILLPWGGLFLLMVLDLALTVPARGIRPEAEIVARGFAGHDAMLAVTLTAKRLPPSAELRLSHSAGLAPAEGTPIPLPVRATSARIDIPIRLRDRGAQTITRLWLRYPSRLHLFEVLPNWALDLTITVMPDISPILSGAIQAQMLPLLDGARVNNLRGSGSEFHQLRDFVSGMDPRSIDWKRSARVNNLVARETRVERNHQIILCLDTGHLMGERLGALTKLDHAIHAALALAWASGLAGDNVGFFSFGARPQPLIPPRPGRAAFGRIQSTCATLEQDEAESNPTLGLSVLNGKLKRRSLVVVFADFVDSTSAELLVENLAVMQRQHVVLYVALGDPAMQALTRPDSTGMEDVAKAIAASRILQERQAVLDRLNRLGILCLDSAPGKLSAALISRYIEIKAKEMI
ncbi:DUF58 domain-containing protein [Gemmobacter serpentinus]|uniref:DUF58 domain-containing protein n=1 Tax=Gemmobacter serpentinus TaxID=2652247 RepID=UPI00124DD248|nr:DUF58 domain-containing protein [Gemmobacter serpentinus]